jgi:hypothetical protein
MAFQHPLARKAKVWTALTRDGTQQRVLVVATTVVLDPKNKKYRSSLVDRLSNAERAYLADSNEAEWFVLIGGKPKEWKPDWTADVNREPLTLEMV